MEKPSKPEGVPVWSHDGILCMADTLKNAVRLNFIKGALIKDPKKLFNTRLDSKAVRAIDFHEDDALNESALKALVLEAVRVNKKGAYYEKKTQLVANILQNDNSLPSGITQNQSEAGSCLGHVVSIESPIELHVYDSLGDHVGLTTLPSIPSKPIIEQGIPGSTYKELQESKFPNRHFGFRSGLSKRRPVQLTTCFWSNE
jgi:hypothetical protein